MKFSIPVITLLALSSCSEEQTTKLGKPADQADYVVIGKSVNTRQEWSGEQKMLNTVFFAEIFQTKEAVAAGGTVMNGYLLSLTVLRICELYDISVTEE